MRIEAGMKVCGVDARQLRDFLRWAPDPWCPEHLSERLGIATASGVRIARLLEEQGYVEPLPREVKEVWFHNTAKGNALRLASAARPITRKTADRVLAAFLERVRTVNTGDYYLYRVPKVLVFGSYLSSRDRVNDIDLAFTLVPKHADRELQMSLERKRSREAARRGRQFGAFIDRLYWPEYETGLFLKNRSRALSFHSMDDLVLGMTETRVLYDDGSADAALG